MHGFRAHFKTPTDRPTGCDASTTGGMLSNCSEEDSVENVKDGHFDVINEAEKSESKKYDGFDQQAEFASSSKFCSMKQMTIARPVCQFCSRIKSGEEILRASVRELKAMYCKCKTD